VELARSRRRLRSRGARRRGHVVVLADRAVASAYTTGVHPVEVEVAGEVVLDELGPTRVDAAEIRAKAAEQSQRLFRRMEDV